MTKGSKSDTPVLRITASPDRALSARIVRRLPMRYTDGADAALDRGPHVRAASSVTWIGNRLAVVQDDANFLALVDPATGMADAITLPAGKDGARQFDDGRDNKKFKLDLEAMTLVPCPGAQSLLAFGSGTKKRRISVMQLEFATARAKLTAGEPVVTPLPALYDRLRGLTNFSGSDMNLEGALYVDGRIRLFGRGNGEAKDGLEPIDATCDLDWPSLRKHIRDPERVELPEITRITQYALGSVNDIPLGFTDAVRGRGACVLYAAAAEASPDASQDGAVSGSALGVLPHDRRKPVRFARVLESNGHPFEGKIEGVVLDKRSASRALLVIDADDYERPAELVEIELRGPWWT
jgi:hypothetical protein